MGIGNYSSQKVSKGKFGDFGTLGGGNLFFLGGTWWDLPFLRPFFLTILFFLFKKFFEVLLVQLIPIRVFTIGPGMPGFHTPTRSF